MTTYHNVREEDRRRPDIYPRKYVVKLEDSKISRYPGIRFAEL